MCCCIVEAEVELHVPLPHPGGNLSSRWNWLTSRDLQRTWRGNLQGDWQEVQRRGPWPAGGVSSWADAGGPTYTNMQRNLALELVRVTEAAALASGKWFGKARPGAVPL